MWSNFPLSCKQSPWPSHSSLLQSLPGQPHLPPPSGLCAPAVPFGSQFLQLAKLLSSSGAIYMLSPLPDRLVLCFLRSTFIPVLNDASSMKPALSAPRNFFFTLSVCLENDYILQSSACFLRLTYLDICLFSLN